ncbi:MAG: GntR family transcriptional regulator [Cytophagales bacterium]|nr:GntR family transcriptional regulator [Cytophagales bacterium]
MDFHSNKSIYLQLADTIKERIIQGKYKEGDKIPSVREFASKMGVNPNTIVRTFNELQTMNIIENKRGIGYFVREHAKAIIIKEKKVDFFEKIFPEFIRQADLLGITQDEIIKYLNQVKEENNEKR